MTRKDPFKYKGSGKYWLRHLRKHGNDVNTEILGVFNSISDLKKVSLDISLKENIVYSKEWANLQPESGDGIAPGWVSIKTEAGIKRIKKEDYDPTIHKHINRGRKHSLDVNKKKGRSIKKTEHTKNKIKFKLLNFYKDNNGSAYGKNWYHDPINKKESFQEECPDGWVKGRLSESELTKQRKSIAHTGTKWYHDPINNKEACLKQCPDGWVKGRLRKKI